MDILTPLDIADWLIEVVLVWCASVYGSRREMRVVFIVGSFMVLSGLWSSPAAAVPLWTATLNRLAGIFIMWAMVSTGERRRAAEEAERKAEAEIKILRGLLPICCVCKSMQDKEGRWHKLEAYLTANSEARLTHGFCPACADRAMAQLAAERAKT